MRNEIEGILFSWELEGKFLFVGKGLEGMTWAIRGWVGLGQPGKRM